MKFDMLILILLAPGTACQKPVLVQLEPEPPVQEAGVATLRVTGYYRHPSCRVFFNS